MRVEDIMTKVVIVGHPEMSLNEIGKIFKEKRISGVPVVNDDNKIIGIVTLTDMLKILNEIYSWKKLSQTMPELNVAEEFEQKKAKAKVKDIMTKDVYTLQEGCTMEDVMTKMFEKKAHTIPIMRGDTIIGIIGKHDLLSACFE